MPRKKKHPQFAELDKRSQKVVRLFALLLRIAESLDRSHSGVIHQARFKPGDGSTVLLDIHASHDCQLELWEVQTHRESFKKVFGKKLVIQSAVDENGKARTEAWKEKGIAQV